MKAGYIPSMNNYDRIASVIRHLDKHFSEQPDLEQLAAVAGLSTAHFHRLFHRWAGTTPKAFVQSLTAREARRMLEEGNKVLDTALEVGLSGPGRLHDLCIKVEAASPGEIASGGKGWTLTCGFATSPFGEVFFAEGPLGICRIDFTEKWDEATEVLASLWPRAELARDDKRARRLCEQVFASPPKSASPLRAYLRGTHFQTQVWRALLAIPTGTACSYGALARAIGRPSSSRAVGTAVGANALAVLIPCHRVLQAHAGVGNYRWGSTRKHAILARERLHNVPT